LGYKIVLLVVRFCFNIIGIDIIVCSTGVGMETVIVQRYLLLFFKVGCLWNSRSFFFV